MWLHVNSVPSCAVDRNRRAVGKFVLENQGNSTYQVLVEASCKLKQGARLVGTFAKTK